jgi:hypothetical protein
MIVDCKGCAKFLWAILLALRWSYIHAKMALYRHYKSTARHCLTRFFENGTFTITPAKAQQNKGH